MRHLVAAKLIIILAAADKIVENAPKVTTRYANIWTSAAALGWVDGWDLDLRETNALASAGELEQQLAKICDIQEAGFPFA